MLPTIYKSTTEKEVRHNKKIVWITTGVFVIFVISSWYLGHANTVTKMIVYAFLPVFVFGIGTVFRVLSEDHTGLSGL
jgi:bacteriorhodopsin